MFEYKSILDNAPVGICFLRSRNIVRCNRRFEDLFGYDSDEINNKSVRILYPSTEMFNHIGEVYGHFFEKNLAYRDERPMMRKDGTMIWCIVTGCTIDSANPHLGQIWVVQDISEHRRTEDLLKESIEKLELVVQQRTMDLRNHIEALNVEVATRVKAEGIANETQRKFQTVFHTMPVGLCVTDAAGRILEANHVFDETIGNADGKVRDWGDLPTRFFLPDDTAIQSQNLPWLVKNHINSEVGSVEIGMRKKRGGKMHWLNVSSIALDLAGAPAILTVFTDITYRRRIEELERLRYAELTRLGRINSMAEMSAALAHQMGQPLVSALNYLNGCRLRLDQMDGAEEISDSVGLAITYLEQAGEILRRVRDFVCRHDPEKIPEDLNAVITGAVSFLNFEIHKHRVSVNLDLASNVPLVPLCNIEIQQVLFNLLKNGMEAMTDLPEDERILTIGSSLRPDRSEVEVFVIDNGRGVARSRSHRLFEPMFTTKPDGIGIGLTICRCIVESHGGKLSFTPMGRQGSRFQITLPIASPAVAPSATVPL